jgi:hypothetical protein
VSDTFSFMPMKRDVSLKRIIKRALFVAETSEWFDWMETQIASRRLIELDKETSVLIAATAIRAIERIEPRYYGSLRRRVRGRMIKAHILLQCWEKRRALPK